MLFSTDSFGICVYAQGSRFDCRRHLVYGEYGAGSQIGVFDYEKFELVKVIDPTQIGGYGGAINDLVVTSDGNKLYYTSYFFTGIDLRQEKVVTQLPLNATSFLGITPDDKYVYLTDPGGYLIPPLPTEKIGVYSPLLEAPLQSIDVSAVPSPCTSTVIHTDQIAMSPDGRKAYVSVYHFCKIMLVIDTRTNQISKVIEVPPLVRFLAIQKPKCKPF